jgi:PhnB protein
VTRSIAEVYAVHKSGRDLKVDPMATTLNPYLNFRGQARDAMDFYQSVFGGELIGNTFAEFQQQVGEGEENQIMHSQLTTPDGLMLMAADVPSTMDFAPGSAISVSLSGDESEKLTGYWQKLSDGANILEELTTAPWGDSFGMLIDKFGIQWLVNISGQSAS